jgi:hypothetical protein
VKVKAKDERRGKMDEKKTNPIRTIERSESLTQGFFVVPLPIEAVFPLPSILSQRTKPSKRSNEQLHRENGKYHRAPD